MCRDYLIQFFLLNRYKTYSINYDFIKYIRNRRYSNHLKLSESKPISLHVYVGDKLFYLLSRNSFEGPKEMQRDTKTAVGREGEHSVVQYDPRVKVHLKYLRDTKGHEFRQRDIMGHLAGQCVSQS